MQHEYVNVMKLTKLYNFEFVVFINSHGQYILHMYNRNFGTLILFRWILKNLFSYIIFIVSYFDYFVY